MTVVQAAQMTYRFAAVVPAASPTGAALYVGFLAGVGFYSALAGSGQ